MNMTTLSSVAAPGNTRFSDVTSDYSWAEEAINELVKCGAISGVDNTHFEPNSTVTKEQFAKMLVGALGIERTITTGSTYSDVDESRWSYPYILTTSEFFYNTEAGTFNPEENYTREKCAYAISMALGYGSKSSNLLDGDVLSNFYDGDKITSAMKQAVAMTVERGIVKGDDGNIRPKSEVTRAEAAVLLYRAKQYKERNSQNLFITQTPMIGKSSVTLEQAKKWATEKGAHQRFIDIADYYWKYGEITGIRPEILYGQAAKETGFGKYTGQVKPEQNNWAGIKIKNPVADRPEDHESFATPEDGVRAHFNHISAYVGTEPVGEPHDRYFVLKTVKWRGTVKNVEQLGGKWAPDVTYGYNIVVKMLRSMENTK
jgi:flagellum-specific peptidoglycan hydrolase FlgJ